MQTDYLNGNHPLVLEGMMQFANTQTKERWTESLPFRLLCACYLFKPRFTPIMSAP
jgi:hypothetical protein